MYTIYNEPTRSSKMEAPLRENPKARAYPSCNHYYINLTYTIGPKLWMSLLEEILKLKHASCKGYNLY